MKFILPALLAVALAAAAAMGVAGKASAHPPTTIGVETAFSNDNPTCSDFAAADSFELKVDPGVSGVYADPNGPLIVNVTVDANNLVSWTSNIGVDVVVVKGGQQSGGYWYAYNPEAMADAGLHAAVQPNGGYAGVSHISFCYDIELAVSKTAVPAFDRDWNWDITKSNDSGSSAEDPMSIGGSQTEANVNYSVVLTATQGADSNFRVSGSITIHNPHPTATATLTSVTDAVTGSVNAAGVVDCGGVTSIAPGATLVCTYTADLGDTRPTGTLTNTATVVSTGVPGGSGSATFSFPADMAPTNQTGTCVAVDDDKYGPLGTACLADSPKTFNYTLDLLDHPDFVCGEVFTNTASFLADDGQTGSASSDVYTECRDEGCTLTQGYWKTHSSYGPAKKADATWLLLPSGPDTAFYSSGKTWYQAFWTAPAGNVYWVLAHQYMAAKLNVLSGASAPANVQAAMAEAEAFFNNTTPAQAAGLKGAAKNAISNLAATLDAYNNGVIGPGHCDGFTAG